MGMAQGLHKERQTNGHGMTDMNARILIRQGLWLALSVCGFLVPAAGKAQSGGWTADACIRYAMEHSPRIRNRQLDARMARADKVAAYGDFLPSIQAVGTAGRQLGRSIDPQTNQYTSESFWESTMGLQVSLPLFEGFSRIHAVRFHKLNEEIHALSVRVEENSLAFEVLEAFYRHCYDREMLELATEQRKLGEQYCEQMREYVDLGMRSLADLQEVKAQLQADICQETACSHDCLLSLLELKELMHMADGDTLALAMTDEQVEMAADSLEVDQLCAISGSVLPEFQVMGMRERAARKSLSMARGAFYPSIRMEFNLNTGYYDTEKDAWGGIVPFRVQMHRNRNKYVGVSVSLPLFAGLSRWSVGRKEKLRLQQVRNENELQRSSLYKEIHATCLAFLAALQECRLAGEQLCAASLTWRESEEKWREGMVSPFELLEKRNRYVRAKAEVVRTKLQCALKKRLVRFYQDGTFLR